jgi:DNA-binding beta-propeller fold protein YncE
MTGTRRTPRNVAAATSIVAALVAGLAFATTSGAQQPPDPGGCLDVIDTVQLDGARAYGSDIDTTTGLVYVSVTGSGRVDVIDPATNTVVDSYPMPVDGDPDFPIVDTAHNTLYVSDFGEDAVYAIDLTTKALLNTIARPDAQSMALNPTTNRLYAAGQTGGIVVIDTTTRAAVDTIDAGGSVLGVAVDPINNLVFAGDYTNATLDVFDGTDNSLVDSWPLDGTEPITLRFDPTTGNVWITTRAPGHVAEIDPSDGSTGTEFDFGAAQGLAINPSINQGYVTPSGGNTLRAFHLDDGSVIDDFPVGDDALVASSQVNPVRVYVSGFEDGTVTIVGDVPPCPTTPSTTTTTTTTASSPSTTAAPSGGVRPRFAG